MIFQGPEGYITPNWYPSKAVHGKVVPTWNFAVVHAYGRPEVMKEKGWLLRHVTELTAQQERNEARPWVLSDAPDELHRGHVARHRRLPLCHHPARRQMEDEPEPRGAGSGGRREGPQRARCRRRSGDGAVDRASGHARQLVSRFRRSHTLAAPSMRTSESKGTLALLWQIFAADERDGIPKSVFQ